LKTGCAATHACSGCGACDELCMLLHKQQPFVVQCCSSSSHLFCNTALTGKDPELGADTSYPDWVFGLADAAPTRQVWRWPSTVLHSKRISQTWFIENACHNRGLLKTHFTIAQPYFIENAFHNVAGAVQNGGEQHKHAASVPGEVAAVQPSAAPHATCSSSAWSAGPPSSRTMTPHPKSKGLKASARAACCIARKR